MNYNGMNNTNNFSFNSMSMPNMRMDDMMMNNIGLNCMGNIPMNIGMNSIQMNHYNMNNNMMNNMGINDMMINLTKSQMKIENINTEILTYFEIMFDYINYSIDSIKKILNYLNLPTKEFNFNKFNFIGKFLHEDISNNFQIFIFYLKFLNENIKSILQNFNIPSNLEKIKINDFIVNKKKEIQIEYYEPYEIEKEYLKISESIENIVIEHYLPEKEEHENETAGKFLYSISRISKKSLTLANIIYNELFNEFHKGKTTIFDFSPDEDRRKLSKWVKNCLNENYYNYYSKRYSKDIQPYLYLNDKNANILLNDIFTMLIKVYTKCLLSLPLIEIRFTKNNCAFENNRMFDIIYKGKKDKLVNFCYLPGLESNGQLLKGGKCYVFTYIKNKSFQIKEDLLED